MVRGGSWNNNGRNVRSANSNYNSPDNRNNNLGSRLSLARQVTGIRLTTRSLSCLAVLLQAKSKAGIGLVVDAEQTRRVNALPILRPDDGRRAGANLEEEYANRIIGGPGAFMVTAESRETFGQAVRRKLVLEIAGLTPETAVLAGLD